MLLAAASGIALTTAVGSQADGSQTIAWHSCQTGPQDDIGTQLDKAGAKCGQISVPLDYRDPGGRRISVAVARRPASDPARRLGTLFVNTGGPGPSRMGVSAFAIGDPDFAPYGGAPDLAARYDLVSFDPRFFGLSTQQECGWPTNLAVRSRQVAAVDRAAFDQSVAVAKELASICAKDPSTLPFASTRESARDMDVLRSALGERKISYFGWSYGTYLGAVYLQMFGQHIDRIVLDSSVDPTSYGPALSQHIAPADAAALRDWAGWAAKRDSRYHLGGSADAVLQSITSITAAAHRKPLQLGNFVVTESMVPGMLLTVVDTDDAYDRFSAGVIVLRDAAKGLLVKPTDDQAGYLSLFDNPAVLPDVIGSATTVLQCAERAVSADPETYWLDIQQHRATEPLYGPLFRNITPCAFWPTQPVEPPTTVDNDHPVLMVGATGDPATPYADQLPMHAGLHGSRLLTLANTFRHGVFLEAGNACVDNTVKAYLLGGPLPGTDLTCQRT